MATWEISWDDQLPLPPTRDQGNRPSCSLEAMMYSAQVINQNNVQRGVLVPEISRFHHDQFRVNFEMFTGTPIGAWWSQYNNWRVPTSLDIFLNHGVAAINAPSIYGYTAVNLSSYQAHDRVSFEQIMHYVTVRHPVLVIIPIAPDFGSFPAGQIYSVSAYWWQQGWNNIVHHMVMVYGCGMRDGIPYVKFLNTYGRGWGQLGTGRVYWNQVMQRPGTELVVYTLEMNGATVPVPPYSPRPLTPPPPDYPDSPQPPAPGYPDSPPSKGKQDVSSRKRMGRFQDSEAGAKKAKM